MAEQSLSKQGCILGKGGRLAAEREALWAGTSRWAGKVGGVHDGRFHIPSTFPRKRSSAVLFQSALYSSAPWQSGRVKEVLEGKTWVGKHSWLVLWSY